MMRHIAVFDDGNRLGADAMLRQDGRQMQHTALVRHTVVGGNQNLHIGQVVHQPPQGGVQDGEVARRFGMLRPVGMHGVIGGGDKRQVVMLPL